MARQTKDVRGLAKAQRENDRQAKKAEKLAKRRESREQRPEPERLWGQPSEPESAGENTAQCPRPPFR